MSAPVQGMWNRILNLHLFGVFSRREAQIIEDELDICGPTAAQIERTEQECAERFKRDQLLPIIGIMGQPPA